MTSLVAGILLGAGLWLLVSLIEPPRERLLRRVVPSIHVPTHVEHSSRQRYALLHSFSRWLTPLWETMGSSAQSVTARMRHLAVDTSVEEFRIRQVIAGFAGFVLALGALGAVSRIHAVLAIQWLLVSLIGFVCGALAYDKMLSIHVERMTRRLAAQVADAADLLCLSISAGESIGAALTRVHRTCPPELGRQLGRIVDSINSGTALTRAFERARADTQSPQLIRLIDTLITAVERGAPLSRVLRDQARDLRDDNRRALIESGGRKEIAMLIPVVFLILPVTVVFALYPGLIALEF